MASVAANSHQTIEQRRTDTVASFGFVIAHFGEVTFDIGTSMRYDQHTRRETRQKRKFLAARSIFHIAQCVPVVV